MHEQSYQLVRSRGVGHAVASFSRACLIRLIDFPEMPLRINTHETVKAGRTALVVRTAFPVENRRVAAVYKRVGRQNWWTSLADMFATHRLLRTWRLGRELRRRHIATPRPLAVIVPRWYQFGREAYLVLEWIERAENLKDFVGLASEVSADQRLPLKQRAAVSLGHLLSRMHEARISHCDLKTTNLLLQSTPRTVETYVIDLDGAKLHRHRLAWNLRLRNLAKLASSSRELPTVGQTDCLRLLKAYLNASAAPKPHWKTAWRQLMVIAEARSADERRRAA